MFCIKLKETRMRDGAKFGDRVKKSSKYNVKEMATHEIIYDYLTELSESGGKNLKVITSVGSDKSRTFTHVFERSYPDKIEEFTDNRINYLIDEIVNLKETYYKKHLDKIIDDYQKALQSMGINILFDPSATYQDKKNAINAALNQLYVDNNENINKVRKKLIKAFNKNNIPFVLDYHYVETKNGIVLKNSLFDAFSLSKEEIRKNVITTMEEDLKVLKQMVPLGTHAAYLVNKLNTTSTTSDIREAYNIEGDTDEYFESFRVSSSDSGSSNLYIKKDYGDNVYRQYILERMLATRMHNTALMGSTYFYKGANEEAMFIEKNKREAALMSTIVPFDTTNPYGISKNGKFVAVINPKVEIVTVTGRKKEWAYDGASYSTELHMSQMKHSLGNTMGQPSGNGSMKTIGVYHDPHTETMTFKKHNDFTITHEMIRKTKGTDLDFGLIQDNMFKNSDISDINLDNFGPSYFNEHGENLTVYVKPDPNKNEIKKRVVVFTKQNDGFKDYIYAIVNEATLNEDGSIKETSESKIKIENLSQLYDALGGAYTYDNINKRYTIMSEKGHSSTILNDIIAHSVMNKKDVRPNIINGFNFKESLKSSQPNLNTLDDLKNNDFVTFTVDRGHEGIQLNASKETDDKEASLPTQVLGALGLASATQEEAKKAYGYLKELVINDISLNIGDNITPEELDRIKNFIRNLTLNALATTNISTLASSILSQTNIPYDNPQLITIVTAALNSYLTSEGIRQKVSGGQFILAPPIQVFDNGEGGIRFGSIEGESLKPISLEYKDLPDYIKSQISEEDFNRLYSQDVSIKKLLLLMDTKSTYVLEYKENKSGEIKRETIDPSLTFEEMEDKLNNISNKLKDTSFVNFYIDTNKPRDLRPARSKIINKETGVVTDIYRLEEVIRLQNEDLTSQERAVLLNKLNDTLNELSKDNFIINYPGEILAPKIWKSRFFLEDQTDYNDISVEYYINLLNDKSDRGKKINAAYKRRAKKIGESQVDENYNGDYSEYYSKEQYAIDLYNSFKKATETVTTRIPLQSLASVMGNKIVGFIDTAENTAMINHEHQILTGGDYDVDKTTLMTYFVDNEGIVYQSPTLEELSSKDSKEFNKKAIVNGLFDAIKEAAMNHKNYVQRESGVDMGDVKTAADNAKKRSTSRSLNEDSSVARMEARYANVDGKVNIGPEAVSIKSFSAITSSFVQTINTIRQLLTEGKVKEAGKLIEYVLISIEDTVEGNKVQSLLSNKDITMSIFLPNLPANDIDTIVEALQYNTNPKYEDIVKEIKKDKEGFKNKLKDIRNIQPQVADELGQLLNAATDNAKYLYLSSLNLNLTTTGIANAMIMMGMNIEQMSELLTNNVFKAAIDDYSGSIFKEKGDYVSLGDQLEKGEEIYLNRLGLKYEQLDDDAKKSVDMYRTLLPFYQNMLLIGEELTTLGQILGINQGLKPTSYGVYTRIYNIDVFMSKISEEGLLVDDKPFSFEKFILDSDYRSKAVEEYEKVKRGVNILSVLNNKPDTIAQLSIAVNSLKAQRVIGKKLDMTIKLIEALREAKIFTGRIKEEQFVALYNGINRYIIDKYLNGKKIEFNGKKYRLDVLDDDKDKNNKVVFYGRKSFIEDVSEHLMDLKQKGVAPGFLSKVTVDTTKRDRVGMSLSGVAQVSFDPNPTGMSQRDVIEELSMKAGIKDLDRETQEALRLYNLILFGDTLKKGSFTKYFEYIPEIMTDYWTYEANYGSALNEEMKSVDVQNTIIAYATRFGFGSFEYNRSYDQDFDDFYFPEDDYRTKEKPEVKVKVNQDKAVVTISRIKEDSTNNELEKSTIEISSSIEPLLSNSEKKTARNKMVSLNKKAEDYKKQEAKKIELERILESQKNRKAVFLGLINMEILTQEC
jgi:hypothetical protein